MGNMLAAVHGSFSSSIGLKNAEQCPKQAMIRHKYVDPTSGHFFGVWKAPKRRYLNSPEAYCGSGRAYLPKVC